MRACEITGDGMERGFGDHPPMWGGGVEESSRRLGGALQGCAREARRTPPSASITASVSLSIYLCLF